MNYIFIRFDWQLDADSDHFGDSCGECDAIFSVFCLFGSLSLSLHPCEGERFYSLFILLDDFNFIWKDVNDLLMVQSNLYTIDNKVFKTNQNLTLLESQRTYFFKICFSDFYFS